MKYSVVLPVFNEEGNLGVLYEQLVGVMENLGDSFEIIFVDDGSTDGSFGILEHLHQKDSNVEVIRFTRNFGQHIAITAGFDSCEGEIIILMDADLQHQPREIPKLLAKLNEGYDIVYGLPKQRRDNILKRLTSKAYFLLITKLTGQIIDPKITSFQVLTRRVINYFNEFQEHPRLYGVLVAWLGFPCAFVEVEHQERFAGKTKYNLRKMTSLAIEGIISFSDLPLRLISYFGLMVSSASFLLGIYVLVRRIFWGVTVTGYTSIIVSLFFLGGVILVTLGVVGQYVGKIHTEVKQRPMYVVRDRIGREKEE